MAYARGAASPREIPHESGTKTAPRAKRGALRRLLDAIQQSNMRRAERAIAVYLGAQGAKFTDESEREIERRFLSNP
jgi:hypothetical protein